MNRQPASLPLWQIIALIAGGVLLLGGVLFLIFRGGGGTEETPRTVAIAQDQVFKEALVGDPEFVNPLLAVSQTDRDLASLVFSGLTRLDEFGQPVPDLAESWTVSRDGLTYKFLLRQDVTWHDGEPFTAEDVAFTMALLRDSDFMGPADMGAFWRTIETYADDDYTVRFVLTQPLASFPEYAGVGILPEHWLGGIEAEDLPDDAFNLDPIGTGPLAWESGSKSGGVYEVVLKPYPDYYDPARQPDFSDVIFRCYSNADRAFNALGSEVYAYGGLSIAQLDAALASPMINVISARLPAVELVIFNQGAPDRLPFFQDAGVRRALIQSVNRAGIVSRLMDRQAVVTDSTILPSSWAYNDMLLPPPYDSTGAAALLDEAGWVSDGTVRNNGSTPFAFTLLCGSSDRQQALAQEIADSWRAMGIDVRVEPVSASEMIERLASSGEGARDYDAAIVELTQAGYADPDPYPFWHESQAANGQNFSGYIDHDMSELLELARRDPNGVRRAEAYAAYQELFIENGAALLLYNPLYHYAVSCQVTGASFTITSGPENRFMTMGDWHIAGPGEIDQACGTGQ